MTKYIGHGGSFRVSAGWLHIIDGVEEVIAEWKSLFGDVVS